MIKKIISVTPLSTPWAVPYLLYQYVREILSIQRVDSLNTFVPCLEKTVSSRGFYHLCSNYAPGAENGPAHGSHVLHRPI